MGRVEELAAIGRDEHISPQTLWMPLAQSGIGKRWTIKANFDVVEHWWMTDDEAIPC